MVDGFGSITWWGFSPCLDLQNVHRDVAQKLQDLNVAEETGAESELNILLVGAGDCRHVLKTCAHLYRHPPTKINFYVLENSLELYARDMLLLSVLLEPPEKMGLQEKTELFLELFGNLQVRAQSLDYAEKNATLFIRMVTDSDFLEETLPLFDLSNLKFKERDQLEAVFKFWRNVERTQVNVEKFLDVRLRHYLGTRYDAIPNVFDWDYNMKLVEKGASIINSRQYARWRQTGSAFHVREGTYSEPNKTLVSGMVFKHDGERFPRRGYWGDILVSPYISFGLESEDKSLLKTANKLHVHTAEDVSEFNVLSMAFELLHRRKYVKPAATGDVKPATTGDVKQTATLTEITEEEEETTALSANEEAGNASVSVPEAGDVISERQANDSSGSADLKHVTIPEVKIYFLPLNSAHDLRKKSKFQGRFDTVYVSNSMVHLLNADLAETFSDGATLVLETAKFMLELKKEQCQEFGRKISDMAAAIGCQPAGQCDGEKDNFATFRFRRNVAAAAEIES